MIRILDRMVTGAFLKLFALFIMGAPLLFVLGDVTENLDSYLARGLTLAEVGRAYLYMFPNFVLWSFPIAALIATVFTVHSMTTHREIVAAKAGGISFHRLVAPLFFWGVLLTGVGLALTELVPRTNQIAAEILREREERREWRSAFVYQGEDGRTVTARRLTVPDRRLTGVVMEMGDPVRGETSTHVVADQAVYHPEHGWTFYNGYLRRIGPSGEERTVQFGQFRSRGFTERPEELLEEPRDHDQMTYGELQRQAEIIRRSGGDPFRILVRMEQKIAIPVATLVIVLFGAPLATTSRRGGAAFGIGVSLGSTILYLLLFRVFGAIGESGGMEPLLAAWMPNALFLAAGLFLLVRVRT